jgi:lipooligosaccharide transport system permease protein
VAYSLRAFEYWLTVYRRVWRGTIMSSVLNPVLYLTAMGIGLGTLVRQRQLGLPYLDFVAPGLLAAVAMQVAAIEASFPVRGAIKWNRQYFAMLATPLRVGHLVTGHLLYLSLRVLVSVALYLLALAAFGALHSWWAIATLPLSILIGLSFGAPISALSAWADEEVFNPLFRFAVTPMFLFSGTFFPVDRLPQPLLTIAYLTPLWHGVELCRDLTLGTPELESALLHIGYLLLWVVAGVILARFAYRKKLVT